MLTRVVIFQIETIELPLDPKSKKRRGFIFITYKDEASVKKCLEKKFHNIEGGRVSGLVEMGAGENVGRVFDGGCCVSGCRVAVRAQDRPAQGGLPAAAAATAAAVRRRTRRRLRQPRRPRRGSGGVLVKKLILERSRTEGLNGLPWLCFASTGQSQGGYGSYYQGYGGQGYGGQGYGGYSSYSGYGGYEYPSSGYYGYPGYDYGTYDAARVASLRQVTRMHVKRNSFFIKHFFYLSICSPLGTF